MLACHFHVVRISPFKLLADKVLALPSGTKLARDVDIFQRLDYNRHRYVIRLVFRVRKSRHAYQQS